MKYLVTIFLGLATTFLLAQNTKSLLYSNPIIGGNEGAQFVVRVKSGYLVGSTGICLPSERQCFSLRKYSINNKVEWEAFFDSISPPNFLTLIANDSSIYLATWDTNNGMNKEFINKLDLEGNILKTVQVDNDTTPKTEKKAIVSLGFIGDSIVLCHNKWLIPAGPDSVFFKFYDKDLNLVKEIKSTENMPRDHVFGLHPTKDGNYLMGKWATDNNEYLRILKVDTQGKTVWKHEEPNDINNPWMGPLQDFVILNKDSSYIFYQYLTEFFPGTGIFPDFPSIQKRSTINDSLIWKYKFYTKNIYTLWLLTKGLSIPNNDLIGVGRAQAFISKNNYSQNLGWIFKMDQSGKLKWSRFIKDDRYEYKSAYFVTATELENGDIVAGGELWQLSINPPDLSWVVHFDSSGCITPGCTDSILYTHTEEINGKPVTKEVFFKTFPNPVKNDLTIEFYNQSHRPNSELKIINLKGQEVNKGKLQTGDQIVHINMSQMISGVYLVQYSSGGVILQTEKVVKE